MGAFADYSEKEAGGALQYYADIAHPLHVAKTAVYVVQTTLGDSVVVRSLTQVSNHFNSSGILSVVGLSRIEGVSEVQLACMRPSCDFRSTFSDFLFGWRWLSMAN